MFNSNNLNRPDNAELVWIGNSNGFSIIELLIAMGILAFGMLAAASMQYSAIRNNTNANIHTQANMLAKTNPISPCGKSSRVSSP